MGAPSIDEAPDPQGPPAGNLLHEALWMVQPARLALRAPWLLRAPRGDGSVVVDVPGWKAGEPSMAPIRGFLRALGHDARAWGLGVNRGDPERDRDRLVPLLEPLVAERGPVALVGWSLGGVVAREVARARPDLVRTVATFGTPVIGGPAHTVGARSMDPAYTARIVRLQRELDQDRPIRVPVTTIYSRRDRIVDWRASIDRATPGARPRRGPVEPTSASGSTPTSGSPSPGPSPVSGGTDPAGAAWGRPRRDVGLAPLFAVVSVPHDASCIRSRTSPVSQQLVDQPAPPRAAPAGATPDASPAASPELERRAPVVLEWDRTHLLVALFVAAFGIANFLELPLAWKDRTDQVATYLEATGGFGVGLGIAAIPALLWTMKGIELALGLVAVAGAARRSPQLVVASVVGWMGVFLTWTVLDVWAADRAETQEHTLYFAAFSQLLLLVLVTGLMGRVREWLARA